MVYHRRWNIESGPGGAGGSIGRHTKPDLSPTATFAPTVSAPQIPMRLALWWPEIYRTLSSAATLQAFSRRPGMTTTMTSSRAVRLNGCARQVQMDFAVEKYSTL